MFFNQEELVGVIDTEAPEELSDDKTRANETLVDSVCQDKTAQADARVIWSHPMLKDQHDN